MAGKTVDEMVTIHLKEAYEVFKNLPLLDRIKLAFTIVFKVKTEFDVKLGRK